MDITTFMDAHTPSLSPVERALAFSAMEDAKAEAIERREQAERDAYRQERTEALVFANRQGGDVLGGLQMARAAFGAADDQVRDLSAQLERAEARRNSAHESIQLLSRRLDEMTAAVSRSAPPPSSGVEGALSRAQEALREAQAQRRVDAMLARTRPGRSRPFGPGGLAVRSEQVTCDACLAVGATPEESFMIHHTDADGQPLSVPADAPVPVPPDETDRAAGRRGREITRLTTSDGMGQVGTLYGEAVR
jgi:hypothetical protein